MTMVDQRISIEADAGLRGDLLEVVRLELDDVEWRMGDANRQLLYGGVTGEERLNVRMELNYLRRDLHKIRAKYQRAVDAEVLAAQLLGDLNNRPLNMGRSHWSQVGLCDVGDCDGKSGGTYRVAVWRWSRPVIAFFCDLHREHRDHFGFLSCSDCGSKIDL